MNQDILNCPCGNAKLYADCCHKAHISPAFISTAEELMRSRYSAFTLANGPYLLETHHSTTKMNVNENDLVEWAKSVEWLRLEIIDKSNGRSTDMNGTVEFKAYFKENNEVRYIHENSYFEKEYGIWKYKSIV